jgi:hypothetical protein
MASEPGVSFSHEAHEDIPDLAPAGSLEIGPGDLVRMDYRTLPLGSPTSYGEITTCPACGRRGANDVGHHRCVHVAWFDGVVSLAAKFCRKGGHAKI